MKKFNEHILLVMRWLQNKDSVSEEEVKSNYHAARKAHDDTTVATYATTYAAYCAADNACYAACTTVVFESRRWVRATKQRLDNYFELSGENRKEYEQRIKHLNVLGTNNE